MNSTRKLTEGAMMVAIVGVLLFINRQSASYFDFALYWVVPLPIIIYTVKYGSKDALAVAISCIILALVTMMPTGMYYTIVGSLLGLIYGHMLAKGSDHSKLVAVACLVSIISNFLTMFVFASVFGYNLMDDVQILKETLQQTFAQTDLVIEQSLYDFLPKMVILSNVLMGIVEGVLVHMLSYIVLRFFKIKIKPMRPLSSIRLSKWMGYALMAIYFGCVYLLRNNIWNVNTDILYTLELLAMIILSVNGYLCAATIIAYKKKKGLSFLLVLCIFPPLTYILTLLGFADAVMNVRDKETIEKNRQEARLCYQHLNREFIL